MKYLMHVSEARLFPRSASESNASWATASSTFTPEAASRFHEAAQAQCMKLNASRTMLGVTPAVTQGSEANMANFRFSLLTNRTTAASQPRGKHLSFVAANRNWFVHPITPMVFIGADCQVARRRPWEITSASSAQMLPEHSCNLMIVARSRIATTCA